MWTAPRIIALIAASIATFSIGYEINEVMQSFRLRNVEVFHSSERMVRVDGKVVDWCKGLNDDDRTRIFNDRWYHPTKDVEGDLKILTQAPCPRIIE